MVNESDVCIHVECRLCLAPASEYRITHHKKLIVLP